MISLILPYWERKEVTDESLRKLARHYADLALEVIVVDDGSPEPYVKPDVDLDVKVIRLHTKADPLNPCVPFNVGAALAKGDYIAISNPEVLHREPVLEQMREAITDDRTYVLAAAWCPEAGRWHCHSTQNRRADNDVGHFLPEGANYHFLGMMSRKLWDRIGGFDEDYRYGAGYDDPDFVMRLAAAGARFVMRDDLVVEHRRDEARAAWADIGYARNRLLFLSKWAKPVVCVKAGDAYGPEYVNILYDMVCRNLVIKPRFICVTDDPRGLDEGIETMPLPVDLPGWWGKLYLFNLFEKAVYFDLDTLIVGAIDEIAGYGGEFALLRDYYRPQGYGSGVMIWNRSHRHIWDNWVAAGRPKGPHGDQGWIETQVKADILQDRFPGRFPSYKAHCVPNPPAGARVICFHGQPKPHNCGVQWVADVWKKGGLREVEFASVANTERERVEANVRAAIKRGLPELEIKPAHERQIVLVAGGPSLKRTLPEVRELARMGHAICAVNNVGNFLLENDILPDWQIILDSRPHNAAFICHAGEHFLASQCDASLFERTNGSRVTLFHMNTEGIERVLPKERPAHLISSGTTVGLAAMAIAYTQGYRGMHLHGYDSSYETQHHAYAQPKNDADPVMEVTCCGRQFKAAPWMVVQAQQFQDLARQLAEAGVTITVAGDGLLPHIAHNMTQEA